MVACALVAACGSSEPAAPAREAIAAEVGGSLTVDGAPARLVRCRPGHAVHVFVEVDTSLGTLRFGEGKLWWQGGERTCQQLDRSWGGGVRRDGSAYFRGTLAFRCDTLAGDLTLDCGGITAAEAGELLRNRAVAGRAAGSAAAVPAGTEPPAGRAGSAAAVPTGTGLPAGSGAGSADRPASPPGPSGALRGGSAAGS
ncbi:MAG TPA: hypothetical protein VFK02_16500 [Kofleriaceae bacterium]|nr:hypothetical protein [Kofleriaceae bacterium]